MVFILVLSILIYTFYTNYFFQEYLHKKKIKSQILGDFIDSVKGEYIEKAYFAASHKLVSISQFKSFSNSHKLLFSKCYSIVKFKTQDADWELYFHLVKESGKYSEILNIRVFPKFYKLKSEGNVEKNYSRLNIFTNNRYLTGVLESPEVNDYLKWLIRHNGDILLVSNNNLHFKAFLTNKKLNSNRIMDMIKAINGIKSSVFRKEVIEY